MNFTLSNTVASGTKNKTFFFENNSSVGGDPVTRVWGSYLELTSAVGLLILVVESLTFYGMVKIKRLPFATKFLFCMNLAADCCFNGILVIATPVNRIFGQSELATEIGTEIGRLAMASSWLCLTMLSLERLCCIAYPNTYLRLVSKERVLRLSLTCMAALLMGKLVARYVVIPYVYNQLGYTFESSKDADILTWILGVCMIVCLTCNGKVLKLAIRHKKELLKQASSIGGHLKINPLKSFKSTNIVWILIIIFAVLYVPWFFIKIVRINNKNTSTLRSTDFIFMIITCCANPFIYAWRLQECRYHILALFGRFSPTIAAFAERKRFVVFSITIKDSSSVSCKCPQ